MIWYVARITSIDKKNGTMDVHCSRLNRTLRGKIPIVGNYTLNEKVRIRVEDLGYAVRIMTIMKETK